MSIAILSDIHGNLHALEAVLRDMEAQGVERVIVNGDMVNRGPFNVEVLERLRAASDEWLLGNHDELVVKWAERHPDLPEAWFEDPFWLGTAWCARQLADAGWLDALRGLPLTHVLAPRGAPEVILSHGSPRHYREGYGTFLNEEQIAEIVQEFPYELLIGSHTHRPLERRWGQHTFLNTGAVGAPFNRDPRAQYLLLTLDGSQWRWHFRAVPYDRDAALAAYKTRGYLAGGGLSAHIFWQELRYARALYAPYWMWVEKEARIKNWQSWHHFRDEHAPHLFEPPPAPSGPLEPDRP